MKQWTKDKNYRKLKREQMVKEDDGNAKGSTVALGMEMSGKYSCTGTSPQEESCSRPSSYPFVIIFVFIPEQALFHLIKKSPVLKLGWG